MTEPMPKGYSPRLYNADLGPLPQKWTWYNIFAFWMSDVHSVGGYVFAASLFALGLASWQVLIALLVGICIIQVIANLLAKPSQQAAVPYPVICRLAFGVFGANIPAVIRGLIAVAWYGVQTYLASSALIIVVLRFFPQMAVYAEPHFAGLSYLGWFGFLALWVVQAAVFWTGMDSIRRFIDWAGPVVYAVMFMLAGWIVWKAGWANISFTLSEKSLTGWEAFSQVIMATALVVSYFSGPTLNFGDFSRYCRSMSEVRRGNFWGLPVNFLAFSLVTVVIVSGTLPVFGEMLHDPIATVARIDNDVAVLLGAFAFVTATIGINIVDPGLRVMLRQIADVGAGKHQNQLCLHTLHRSRTVLEAVACQLRLAPVAPTDHALLGNHRLRNTPLGKQRMPIAAVQPVLFAVERLIQQAVHARGKRADGQVQAVVQHPQLQLVGTHYRQVQMHGRVLFAIGPDHFGERQRPIAHRRVQHPEIQGPAQFALECRGIQFETFQLTEQAQGFLMKQLTLAGQTETATATVAQDNAQGRLQLAHVGTDRRCRQIQLLLGAGEALVTDHANKDAQQFQVG
jgi:NCS1 nucleoside transporter family